MGKGSILLLFMVAAAICLLMGNLPAATLNAACGCGTWLPEVNTCETTVAADQVQLQAVQVEKDIGTATNNDVLVAVGQDEMAQKMTLQNEILTVKSTGSGVCFST